MIFSGSCESKLSGSMPSGFFLLFISVLINYLVFCKFDLGYLIESWYSFIYLYWFNFESVSMFSFWDISSPIKLRDVWLIMSLDRLILSFSNYLFFFFLFLWEVVFLKIIFIYLFIIFLFKYFIWNWQLIFGLHFYLFFLLILII